MKKYVRPIELFRRLNVKAYIGSNISENSVKLNFSQDNGEWQKVKHFLSLYLGDERVDDIHASIIISIDDLSDYVDDEILEEYVPTKLRKVPKIIKENVGNKTTEFILFRKFFEERKSTNPLPKTADFELLVDKIIIEDNKITRLEILMNSFIYEKSLFDRKAVPMSRETMSSLLKFNDFYELFMNAEALFMDGLLIINFNIPEDFEKVSAFFEHMTGYELSTLVNNIFPFRINTIESSAILKSVHQTILGKELVPTLLIPTSNTTSMEYSVIKYKDKFYVNILLSSFESIKEIEEMLVKDGTHLKQLMEKPENFFIKLGPSPDDGRHRLYVVVPL